MRTNKWSWVNNSEWIIYFIYLALLFLLMGSTEVKRFPQTYLLYELGSLKKAYTTARPGALEAQASLWRCDWLGKSDCITSVLSLTKQTKIPAAVILNLTDKCQVLSVFIVNPKKPSGCDWSLLFQGICKYITEILRLSSRLSTLMGSILGCHQMLYPGLLKHIQ